MQSSRERAIGGVTSGLIGLHDTVTWSARHLGVQWKMTVKITEFDRPRLFVDEMQRGPFTSFRHEHHFEQHGQTTTMRDVVTYRLPLGALGSMADAAFVARYLHTLLRSRNQFVRDVAAR